jgi:hypothetical protein
MRRLHLFRPGLILLGVLVLLAALSTTPRFPLAEGQGVRATLTIADQIPATAGETVQVPITLETLETDDTRIATIAMVIDYDTQWLTLDPNDANNDDIPDSVAFALPSGASGLVPDIDLANGTISIFVGDLAPPFAAFQDGTIATLTFEVADSTTTTSAAVGFASDPPVSFGSTTGTRIPGTADGGSVQITPAAPPTMPTLSIATDTVVGNDQVQIPVRFAAADQQVAAVAFVLDYDAQWLTLDPTDANDDDIPDSIALSLPSGFSSIIPTQDASSGTVGIFIGDLTPPFAALPDGTLATLTFEVANPTTATTVPIGFASQPPLSFGSPQGTSIPGTANSGTVQIMPDSGPTINSNRLYLPVIIR